MKNERLLVWKGTLKKTSGGLTKKDLKKNKQGKIVSKKASAVSKKRFNSKAYAHVKASFKANHK
jgi:hypothetical protein